MSILNNTIQKIIELDQAARERVEQAQQQAQKITEECIGEQERLTAETDEDVRAKIESINGEYREKADKEIEFLRAQSEQKCRRLSEIAKQNAPQWQSEILERIFGR